MILGLGRIGRIRQIRLGADWDLLLFSLLFVILHVEEIVTGVFEGERRADVGKLHLLMQELDTRGCLATVITLGDGGGTVSDVTAQCLGLYAEDDSHIADFEVDGGVLLDLGENFFCIFHSILCFCPYRALMTLARLTQGDALGCGLMPFQGDWLAPAAVMRCWKRSVRGTEWQRMRSMTEA